jgi:hypothetical protein
MARLFGISFEHFWTLLVVGCTASTQTSTQQTHNRNINMNKEPIRMNNKWVLVAAFVLSGCSITLASPVLSLRSIPVDLTNLEAGEEVTVEVVLAGLRNGEQLDYFSVIVEFDEEVFYAPQISPGAIVRSNEHFEAVAMPGYADASYFAPEQSEPIFKNGVFFTLLLEARAAHEGEISLTSVDAEGLDALGEEMAEVMIGESLDFKVAEEDPGQPIDEDGSGTQGIPEGPDDGAELEGPSRLCGTIGMIPFFGCFAGLVGIMVRRSSSSPTALMRNCKGSDNKAISK